LNFKNYLNINDVTLKDMEKRTGINFRTLSLYKLGRVLPSLSNAYKVYKATKGKVGLKDWFL